jgi:hypothetical protein
MHTAGPRDYPVLRALALAWFPAETLLDAALYRQLLATRTICARIAATDHGPAGYYALWPLTHAAYESLTREQIRERDLGVDDIVAPRNPRARVLYVADVCMGSGAPGLVLLRDLRRTLSDLLRPQSNITRVAAWAFSRPGAHLAGRLGMLPVPHNPTLVRTTATSIMSRLAARPQGRQR